MNEHQSFGSYMRTLRENRRLTLRDVEEATGVSNGYLSLVERGLRGKPSAKMLAKLATCYGLTKTALFDRAGYFEDDKDEPSIDERLDYALEFIRGDPDYRFGARMPGEMSRETKQFVIKMYEELTGKKLLAD